MAVRSFLHRHSTLCGFLAAAAIAALFGYLTKWSVPVVVLTAFVGVWVFPRAFYGKAAIRALEDAPATPDSFSAQRHFSNDLTGIGSESLDLEQSYEAKRSAARGEFNVRRTTGGGRSEPTVLLSRRATITLISTAVALCAIVFAIQYAAEQFNLRTHPHHWYAVHMYIPVASRRSSYGASRGISITGIDGPYASRGACEQYLKTQTAEYLEALACREMTDADAAAAQNQRVP